MITPVFGQPLLLAQGDRKILVAADLHLGLEHELWLGGVCIPSQTGRILERLIRSLETLRPDLLLLIGDVKHNVPRTSWQEKREIPDFLRALREMVRVEIVPGNHDSGLADMAPSGVRVRPPSGIILDGVGYFHGHTWPDKSILQADLLVTGHLHPAVRLKDPLGNASTHRAWARGRLLPEAAEKQYGFSASGEMIIVPAYNHLCGGLPLNEPCEEMRGPILSMIDLDGARIYLMDGADLGKLSAIKAEQRNRARQ